MSMMGLGAICQGKQKGVIENKVFANKCGTESIHRITWWEEKEPSLATSSLKICKATNKK